MTCAGVGTAGRVLPGGGGDKVHPPPVDCAIRKDGSTVGCNTLIGNSALPFFVFKSIFAYHLEKIAFKEAWNPSADIARSNAIEFHRNCPGIAEVGIRHVQLQVGNQFQAALEEDSKFLSCILGFLVITPEAARVACMPRKDVIEVTR